MKRDFLKPKSWIVAVAVLFALTGSIVGAPFDRQITYRQPDGQEVLLHGWGDEFQAVFETQSGYTAVFDKNLRAYCFAALDGMGDLVSTGTQIHLDDPSALGLVPHLRKSEAVRNAQALERWINWDTQMRTESRWQSLKVGSSQLSRSAAGSVLNAPPSFPTIGTKVGLALLIDFSDEVATISQTEIDEYCNGDNYTGYGNNGSVKKYFYDVSGGMLTYSNIVTVYVRVPQPKTYYNDVTQDTGQQANLLIKDALDVLKALPNYNSQILPALDNLTADASGEVIACNVFFAGQDSGAWSFGLWPHSWALYIAGAQPLGNGKRIFRYQITNIGSSLTIGTFCHENGHMLCGYPDLYDYQSDSTGGAGSFCLMGSGNYGGGGLNPVGISAYLKRASGWGATTDLTIASNLLVTASTAGVTGTNINQFFRFQKPGMPTEYYLIENRQKLGRDADIPGAGLAIWHVDELGDRDNQSTNYNNSHLNYELALIQADNQFHFERGMNQGNATDLFYSSNSAPTYTNAFSDFTTPQKSFWWDGTPSGMRITEISGLSTDMTFLFGDGSSGPSLSETPITAPRQPWGNNLSVMNGSNPNGDWLLFVQDDKVLDSGVISNGWSVTLTSANPVGFAADNEVIATASYSSINLGSTWNVAVTVTNYGPSIATNVFVTNTLPVGAGVSLASSVPSSGIVFPGASLLWSVGDLSPGSGAVLNLSFNTAALGSYTNSVTVASTTTDSNPDNDTATAIANVAVLTPPAFASITFAAGVPTFNVTNAAGATTAIIEASTNLVGWLPIYTNTTPFSFTDNDATNYLHRFYRTLLAP